MASPLRIQAKGNFLCHFQRGLALRSRVLVLGRRAEEEGRRRGRRRRRRKKKKKKKEGQNLEIAFSARVILG